PWMVDLSPWAGQDVELTLRTEPGENSDHDYLFVGAPTVSGQPESAPRRVIVIAVDTLRPDHLGAYGYPRDTSPELDALAETSVVFDHAWAPAPRTRPSFRSAFTGRGALEAVGSPNIAETFQQAGFATGGIVANIHLSTRFGFNTGFDHWALSSSTDAEPQVDAALAWLTEHEHEDSFLFLHLMDPHLFYSAPEPYDTLFDEVVDDSMPRRFNRWKVLDWIAEGTLTEQRKAYIQSLYDGEVAYMSSQVGRLLEGLDALGPNTTVVFHTDHGEEFWEHGGFEHNHALWDEVVRTALWVRPPPSLPIAAQRLSEPVANMDIGPTLLDMAGLSGPPVDGRSLLPLMAGTDAGGWDRALPVAHLMYDVEQWGVVFSGHKYILHTASGKEQLFNLVLDPGEQSDIAPVADLSRFRRALALAHGMDVGPGWRLQVELTGDEPLVWELPAPAIDAFVIDPEAARTSRANQVWGETPSIQASDVGTVSLSADGKTLTLVPGQYGDGIVAIRFAEPVAAGGFGQRGGTLLRTYEGTTDWRARGPTSVVRVEPGTVLRPPPSESDRITALADPDSTDQALLEALGYVGGGE
ncbi:MAG: arylsulfatase A-like enzyme, partial [Myxococcota bacterium]